MSEITEKAAEKATPQTPTIPEVTPEIPAAPASNANAALSNGKATKTPPMILQEFLDEKGLELRLTPPQIRNMEGGGLLIDPPLIVVNYRQQAPVAPATNKN